jgi:hypothetical protein
MHRLKTRTPSDEPHEDQSDGNSFHGFPSSGRAVGALVKGLTPYRRGRGAGCANPEDRGEGEATLFQDRPNVHRVLSME